MPPDEQDPSDWFWDPLSQRYLRHSGVERWRRILAEKRAQLDQVDFVALRRRFGLPPRTEDEETSQSVRPSAEPSEYGEVTDPGPASDRPDGTAQPPEEPR